MANEKIETSRTTIEELLSYLDNIEIRNELVQRLSKFKDALGNNVLLVALENGQIDYAAILLEPTIKKVKIEVREELDLNRTREVEQNVKETLIDPFEKNDEGKSSISYILNSKSKNKQKMLDVIYRYHLGQHEISKEDVDLLLTDELACDSNYRFPSKSIARITKILNLVLDNPNIDIPEENKDRYLELTNTKIKVYGDSLFSDVRMAYLRISDRLQNSKVAKEVNQSVY